MSKLETIQSEYKQLTDREHVLLRCEMYAGSRKPMTVPRYLLHADGKVYANEVQYIQAVQTLANELICNSYDEAVRTRRENKGWVIDVIDVVVDLQRKSLTVRDNGGIPVAIDSATNMLIPTMLFGHLRTGSNYTDERGDVGGQNGIGSVLVNIMSNHFHVRTADGHHQFQQSWHSNMSIADEPVISDSKEHFSEFIAEFDTDKQRCGIDPTAYDLNWARTIEMRCAEVAAMTASWDKPVRVLFKCIQENGKEWTQNFYFKRFEEYLQLWPNNDRMIIDKQYRFNIAMGLSNGQQESSAIVNALQCPWGSHINAFIDACIFHIRAFINNKYKIDLKPAKIRSYLKTVSTWQVNAATFQGQTKELLVTEVKDFGMPVIPSEQFIKKLLRSEIVQVIIDELHNRIAAQRKAELAAQQKEIDKRTKRNILPQKLADAANAGKPGKYSELFVVEGDSASSGIKRFRHAETQGVFALFGKSCGNMTYSDEFRVLANKAMSTLCQGLGFSFIDGARLRYDKIIISCDADVDGSSICGLLLTFFNKFMPEVIEQGRLYRLATPIITAKNLKTHELLHFYSLADFKEQQAKLRSKDWSVKYIKGLASLNDDDYDIIMTSPKLIQLIRDDVADGTLMAWFGADSSIRKELMQMADVKFEDEVFDSLYNQNMAEDDADYEQEHNFQ